MTKQHIVSILIGIGLLIFLPYSQKLPHYINIGFNQFPPVSKQLQSKLSTVNTPITATCFLSNELARDLNFKIISAWIQSISSMIQLTVVHPFQQPEVAEQFDITNDGILVFEHNDKRSDIDLIEIMITQPSTFQTSLQQYISNTLIKLTSIEKLHAILIHSELESMLLNDSPTGLSGIKALFDLNFIDISEQSLLTMAQFPQNADLIILHKIKPFNNRSLIQNIQQSRVPMVIFNHPKLAPFMNQLLNLPSTQLNSYIIQDPTNSTIHSKSQLIVNYTSMFNDPFIGVFPFSGSIDYPTKGNGQPLALTSAESFVEINKTPINGPYAIIYQLPNHILINNFLLPTNYWINQGDNARIVEDIINTQLRHFPVVESTAHSPSAMILSFNNIMRLIMIVIIFPPMLYFFGFALIYYFASAPKS